MSRQMITLLLGAVSLSFVLGVAPPEKCERTWKKVGCYHDRIIPNRPFPDQLLNHRDPISNIWDGHLIDWKQWPQSLHALACKCGVLTKARGHKYFGLQFYGECWSGPSEQFYRDGPSEKCIGIDYKPCNNNVETECVGKAFTNYVYMLEDEKNTEEKIPGGWSEWSNWTPCSAKCNGGEKSRERVCNNPEPQYGGAECEGEPEEAQECNTEPCEPVCKKELEVGVILDASSSVTRKNWNKTIEFVKTFSEEFDVSPTEVHFGVLSFDWNTHLHFTISDKRYWFPKPLHEKLDSIEYTYGGTRTDLALESAEEKFFCKTCGLREGVPKLLLVLTDGKSSASAKPMTQASRNLKKKLKVNIISIGVGAKIDKEELQEIASDEEHVFILDGYAYLKDKINDMLKVACRAKFL